MARTPLPDLRLSLQFADPAHRALLPRHKVARWIRAGLELPATITVRITPSSAPGTVVSGHLYVDTIDLFSGLSDELVGIPYSYTVGAPGAGGVGG